MVVLSLAFLLYSGSMCAYGCACSLQESLISKLSDVRNAHNRSTLNNLSVHLIRSTYLRKLLSLSLIHCSEEQRDIAEWLGFEHLAY